MGRIPAADESRPLSRREPRSSRLAETVDKLLRIRRQCNLDLLEAGKEHGHIRGKVSGYPIHSGNAARLGANARLPQTEIGVSMEGVFDGQAELAAVINCSDDDFPPLKGMDDPTPILAPVIADDLEPEARPGCRPEQPPAAQRHETWRWGWSWSNESPARGIEGIAGLHKLVEFSFVAATLAGLRWIR